MDVANDVFYSGLVKSSEPNFFFTNLLSYMPNDTYINSQWSVKNTSTNVPDGIVGTAGCDMRVDSAWNITLGSDKVLISVVDTGIDTLHEDLAANLKPGTGYNFYNNTPGGMDDHRHGTSCAGIIGAVGNNNLGTSGISPNCKMIAVKIFNSFGSTTSAAIINGLLYSWQQGQWVSSNSWSGGAPIAAANTAITDGRTLGRNGKGTIFVFATGNGNSDVSWPASQSDVLSVGGVSPCNQRKSTTSCDLETWWGANYGTGLHIVAPCVKVYASDITGAGGYTPTNYHATFNGTSSATPNTAGVCALVLAVDSTLRWDSVRAMIDRFADKVGAYTYDQPGPLGTSGWNNQMGYGKVNAYRTVKYTYDQLNSVGSAPCEDFISGIFPPPSFTLEYTGTNLWSRQNVSAYGTGSGSAMFNFYQAGTTDPIHQSLVSGNFDAVGANTYLTFDQAYAPYTPEYRPDTLIVESSNNFGTSYTTLATLIGRIDGTGELNTAPATVNSFVPGNSQWRPKVYSIPVGTNKIRLKAKSGWGNNLYIDNLCVQVLATPVSNQLCDMPQGFYRASPFPQVIQDTIRVYLRRTDFPNVNVDSVQMYIFNYGCAFPVFTRALSGSYHLVFKHRNSIETWTNAGVPIYTRGQTFITDLITDNSIVYGNNQALVDPTFSFYGNFGGDIDRNNFVDGSDVLLVSNAANTFLTGYVQTDVTGDNIVNLDDILLTHNNSVNFVQREAPMGADFVPEAPVMSDPKDMVFENDAQRQKYEAGFRKFTSNPMPEVKQYVPDWNPMPSQEYLNKIREARKQSGKSPNVNDRRRGLEK